MKKTLLLFILALLPLMASAYDAEIDGIYYDFSGNEASVTYRDKNYNSYSGSVSIPSEVTYNGKTYSVKSIGNSAFSSCSGLTSITIPESMTSIGDYAFFCCKALTSITIPNNVTSIGYSAFSGCYGLTSITILCPKVGESWFSSITSLREVVLGKSVTNICESAFSGCSGLTSIIIPNNVKSIGDGAFSGCPGLTSITIGNSVTSIGNRAFSGCSGLTSVTIPSNVKSIGDGAFSGCPGLISITVETGNANYDSRDNCNAIIKTTTNTLIAGCMNTVIPNSVTSIGEWAFYGCSGLTSIDIPNSVTSIGNTAFHNCTALTSIDIPNSVTSIGYYAFYNCTALTSIDIPNSVTCIGGSAFYGCTALTSVTIPNSVTDIDDKTFYGCSNITDVYCYARKVPTTGHDVFKDSNILSATLHVPAVAIELYKNAEPWNLFMEIVAIEGDIPPITPRCTQPTIIYKNGKLQFTCATQDVEYVYNISTTNASGKSTDGVIDLSTTFTVSVYATREGYIDSETVTITIGTPQVGDMNGDGLISIADVTTLVNLILGRN